MKKFFKSAIMIIGSIMFFTTSAFSASVTVTNISGDAATLTILQNNINSNTDFQHLGTLTDFSRGMADTQAATATNGASLFGYQNYDYITVSTGLLFAYQLPKLGSSASEVLEDDLQDDGDTYAGGDMKFTYVNVGINTSFLIDRTYVNFKAGGLDTSGDDYYFNSKFFAIGMNYNFIDKSSMPGGLFKWRGVTLKTGFVYQQTDSKLQLDFEKSYTGGSYSYDLKFDLHSETTTYTIPFEIATSQQIFWILNLAVGAGVDLNFGKTDLTAEATDVTSGGTSVATVTVNGVNSSGENPTLFRPKLMVAAGTNLGPVKIDVPFYYYPAAGWSWGVSLAAVF